MTRPPRQTSAGYVYHVINRSVCKMGIFSDDDDYQTFLRTMRLAQDQVGMRICSYCLMINHWHIALWPERDDAVPRFMHRLTSEHVRLWRVRWELNGHLYQGRYKSFIVTRNQHYQTVVKYIERNPVRASLVKRAEDWKYSSAYQRENPQLLHQVRLDKGPVPLRSDWLDFVNKPEPRQIIELIRTSSSRGTPFDPERPSSDNLVVTI